jgi:flavin reductase
MENLSVSQLISEESFKSGMQQLAASVTVITSSFGGSRRGMTATAVCSLAADPPSLILCVNRSARTYGHISGSRKFCVNVLSDQQKPVADTFASSKGDGDEKFLSVGSWTESESGQPMLDDCMVNFVCDVDRWVTTKTHSIVIGLISEMRVRQNLSPLLYMGRNYSTLSPIAGL